MAIQLTAEEQAVKRQREELAQAKENWKKALSDKITKEIVGKRSVTNPNKIRAYKRAGRQEASKILKALDDGMIF